LLYVIDSVEEEEESKNSQLSLKEARRKERQDVNGHEIQL
jgi:hypothetical protein